MSDAGEVHVSIGAKTDGLENGIKSAVNTITGAFAQLQGTTGGLNAAFGSLLPGLGLIAGAFSGLAIITESIEYVNHLAEEINKLSQKTGIGSEGLTQLKFAASMADVEFGTVSSSLNKMARTMEEAAKGTGTASVAYRALGVVVTNADGSLRASDAVLGDLAEKFAALKDGPGKAAIAMQIFGRAGAEMIPLLNKGKEGLAELGAEARRLGVVMSEDAKHAANQYNDALKTLHAAFDGIKMTIGNALIPAITLLTKVFSTVIEVLRMGVIVVGNFMEALAGLMTGSVSRATEAWHTLKKEIGETGQAIADIWKDKKEGEAGGLNAPVLKDPRAPDLQPATQERQNALNALAADEEAARHRVAMGEETEEALLRQHIVFAERRRDVEMQYADAVEALYSKSSDAFKKVQAQNAQAITTANQALTKSYHLLTENFAKSWKTALENVGKSFGKAFNDMTNRTASFADGVRNILASLQQSFFDAIGGMVGRWIAGETEKTAASLLQAIRRITIFAGESAAGAFTSVVGTPFVGPVIAPAAAATALATVLGYGATLASAAGGFDVPSGLNPVTQLHANEMVLPADLANGIRSMVAGGGGGGGGGGGITIHVHAVDADSVRKLFLNHQRELGIGIRATIRNGHLTGAVVG